MALYAYTALTREGKRKSGQLDAVSQQMVKDQLIKKGLYPVTIVPVQDAMGGEPWYRRIFVSRVSTKEKILFTKQLAVLLKSGVPLLQAMELLVEQFEGRLRTIIIALKDGIKEGASLANGLQRYPKVFNATYVQLVRAGEASGSLETILNRLTEYLEKQATLRKEIVAATRYPLILFSVVGIAVAILLTVVVPGMAQTFADQGTELPVPTKILLSISAFMQQYYWLVGLALGGLVVGYQYWVGTPRGRYIVDTVKLRLPLVKMYARITTVVRFCRTLGMLLESGVLLSEALDIVVDIVDNSVLADVLVKAKENIVKEGKITQYLRQTNIFPPIAIYLIKTGEESGELAYMLQVVASNYEEDLSELTARLLALLQPAIMLFAAVVVGFIIMAIALPIMNMNEPVNV